MTSGRTVILNPTSPESVKRRKFLLDSLRKSGLEYSEEIEETRIVIMYAGEQKQSRKPSGTRKLPLPAPVALEKCLKSRFNCDSDDAEYWDEMILLSAERESATVERIRTEQNHFIPVL